MLPCISKTVVGPLTGGDCVKTLVRTGDIAQTMSRQATNYDMGYMLKNRASVTADPGFPVSWVITCNTADGSTLNESVSASI